jgi:hypothetical protein
MPYIPAGRKRAISILATVAVVLAVPTAASAASTAAVRDGIANALSTSSVTPMSCLDPALTQPFSAFGDQSYYALAPGESDGSFTGDGWLFLNGASITTATLRDGSTGDVLDLPGGSMAISPPTCVASNYRTARTMVRPVSGDGGVRVFVTYAGASSWNKARDAGVADGPAGAWGLSDNLNLHPANTSGWQTVRFALVSNDGSSDYQVYNFYVDPYAKR